MKVLSKQKNSKMCFICGMDNYQGFKSQFYNMEDGSVITPVRYKDVHQSFPQRVHGGLIATMLDELACRAYWVDGDYTLGVTTSMELKYRKPVPYNVDLLAQGYVIDDKSRMFKTKSKIIDKLKQQFIESGYSVAAAYSKATEIVESNYVVSSGAESMKDDAMQLAITKLSTK